MHKHFISESGSLFPLLILKFASHFIKLRALFHLIKQWWLHFPTRPSTLNITGADVYINIARLFIGMQFIDCNSAIYWCINVGLLFYTYDFKNEVNNGTLSCVKYWWKLDFLLLRKINQSKNYSYLKISASCNEINHENMNTYFKATLPILLHAYQPTFNGGNSIIILRDKIRYKSCPKFSIFLKSSNWSKINIWHYLGAN